MNRVILRGRLGRDPERREFPSGGSIVTFSLATDDSYTDRNGQRQTRTDWHRIVCGGRQGDLCMQYLHKGRDCIIEGSIHYRSWKDQQTGQDQYVTEIRAIHVEFLGGKNDTVPVQEPNQPVQNAQPAAPEAVQQVAPQAAPQAAPAGVPGGDFPTSGAMPGAAMDEVPF